MSKNLFSFPNSDMTEEEFNEAMSGLISKGLAVRTVVEDREFFFLTPLGQIVSSHTRTDPSQRN